MRLDNKIALITGASRGIGEAMAHTFAAAGAKVVLVSRKLEELKRVQGDIERHGGLASVYNCNTGELDQIEKLFEYVQTELGGLDILVNNSATNPHFGPMIEVDPGVYDKTMGVNLRGTFFMCQHACKIMLAKGGNIINVASVNGIRPAAMQGVYSVTKAGIIALTQALAKEMGGQGIRVNALLPGLTDTKFAAAITQNDKVLKQVLPLIPMGRIAAPEEIVGAALYLASDAASYTNGTILNVDGGYLA